MEHMPRPSGEHNTAGRLMVDSSSFVARLREGRVTVRSIERAEQWLSDHWLADLDWPADIPRPAPRKDAA